jgi:hypothetical protein
MRLLQRQFCSWQGSFASENPAKASELLDNATEKSSFSLHYSIAKLKAF